VGEYTAAAVATFAFGQRHAVLDTNVRRVLARAVAGAEFPAKAVTRAERELATGLLPGASSAAATWSVGVMELGALVCTAGSPTCVQCPITDLCAWRLAGYPAHDGPPRQAQTYAGTDRQCRGQLLRVVRETSGAVHRSRLDVVWSDEEQRDRCLASLLADGLVVRRSAENYALP